MIITLTGFMGSGKSCVGRILAERTGWKHIDLDKYIEHKCNQSIAEIFAEGGEERFRAVESEALRDLVVMHDIAGGDLIISLGGGTITVGAARELILKESVSIYLQAGLDTIFKRLGTHSKSRPLFNDKYKIEELLDSRAPLYEMASIIIETDGLRAEEVADRIMERIQSA